MPSEAEPTTQGIRRTTWVLGLILIGFSLAQYVFVEVRSALQGDRETTVSDSFIFFLWILVLEWTLFAVVFWALRRDGKRLADMGLPAIVTGAAEL